MYVYIKTYINWLVCCVVAVCVVSLRSSALFRMVFPTCIYIYILFHIYCFSVKLNAPLIAHKRSSADSLGVLASVASPASVALLTEMSSLTESPMSPTSSMVEATATAEGTADLTDAVTDDSFRWLAMAVCHIYIYIYLYLYIFISIYIYICVKIGVCVYIYIYIYIYIFTFI